MDLDACLAAAGEELKAVKDAHVDAYNTLVEMIKATNLPYNEYRRPLKEIVQNFWNKPEHKNIQDQYNLYVQLLKDYYISYDTFSKIKEVEKAEKAEKAKEGVINEVLDGLRMCCTVLFSSIYDMIDHVIPMTGDNVIRPLHELVQECASHPSGEKIQTQYELWFKLSAMIEEYSKPPVVLCGTS